MFPLLFFHNFQFIHFAIVAALDQMLIANARESSDWMSERVFFVCLTFLVDYIYLSIRLVLIRCIMTLFSFQRKISTFFSSVVSCNSPELFTFSECDPKNVCSSNRQPCATELSV